MEHVIIGAGPAGVIAAETLRKLDPSATVTIVGDEPEPPYSRMALPYLLVGNIDERGTYLRKGHGHFESRGIDVRQGRVTRVDSQARRLHLAGDGEMSYDRLLVATGSTPMSPPIPGADLPGVVPCWTLEHGRRIAERARPGSDVVLMGAGFIGCIILEALVQRGVNLTVVELEDRMVPRMMNEAAGGMLKRWCESRGVRVLTSTKVQEIAESGDGLDVALDSGETLHADLVISATGVKPNTQCLEGTGIEVDGGVLVDDRLQSSDPNIFAAGDVARSRDLSTGEYSVHAIQPVAADHGRVAAANMAGRHASHVGSLNMNVLDTLGLISASFGLWMGAEGGDSSELNDPERFRYMNLQFEDDVLVGACSLGWTEHVGVIRGLIQGRVRLGRRKRDLMDDPTRLMTAYLASTQTLGATARLPR